MENLNEEISAAGQKSAHSFLDKEVRGWRDTAVIVFAAAYSLFLVWWGISQWGRSNDWELGSLAVAFFLGVVTIVYTVLVTIFGWKKFKNIEIGFLAAWASNWFFAYATSSRTSYFRAEELYNFFLSILNIFAAPMALVYAAKLISEWAKNRKNNVSNTSLLKRIFGILLLVAISYVIVINIS